MRALEVLERMGNKGAIAMLEDLAQGAPEAFLTAEARHVLGRIRAKCK